MAYTVDDISRITGGFTLRNDLPPGFSVSKLSVDSRTVIDGESTLFFALKGIRHNGHHFIEDLIGKGVKAFVVSENVKTSTSDKIAVVHVSDTLDALQKLSSYHRSRFHYPVIGITGSNGKTIVKEWLHDLLADHYCIVRSPKSFNSQVGVPLSVWNMDEKCDLAIFEAGISQPGEMKNLEQIIRPTIGIFTNIGDAHQENFISIESKIWEKLQLFRSAEKLIYCADHDLIALQAGSYCKSMEITPITWSLHGNRANIQFRNIKSDHNSRIETNWGEYSLSITIPFTDYSSIENCCHCLALISTLDADITRISEGFARLSPLAMRLEIKKGIQNSLLINDYYNSDINSLEIALTVLNQQAEKNHLRKMVILSDIRQSGYSSGDLYRKVNRMLENTSIDLFIGIGRDIKNASKWISAKNQLFETTNEFISNFRKIDFTNSAVLIKGAREFRFEEISSVLQQKAHQSVFEINLNTMVENLNIFRSRLNPKTRIMVMVKAFSYGTGDVEIAKMLQYQRVDYLAVAVADEGIGLRNAGISLPIIVMNPEMHSFQHLIDYRLEPNIYSIPIADDFSKVVAHNAIEEFPVHIKLDTGMNRLGFKTIEELGQLLKILKSNPQLLIRSVFSHLVASDDSEFDGFTQKQIHLFDEFSNWLQVQLSYRFERHILNSAGIERFPGHQYEMVRLGIGLYGISSTNLPLKPIGILRSSLSQIKTVMPGETVGYNRSGKIEKPSEIAIIPLGYADGLDRRLGNGIGSVFIRGARVPLIGNICMDMCMADVTGIGAQPGDEAEFFGHHISISEVSGSIGTIPYEILTGISQRVKRVYIQE